MKQIPDNQIEKIIEILKNSKLTAYFISQKTGISQQSIHNYRNGLRKPNHANAKLLEHFFYDYFSVSDKKNSENIISENNNIIENHNDARQYYSDSPDVLKAQIDILDERIKEKDAQIKEKDAQIKEKDAQIKELLEILKGYNKK